jgi:hypothetical protein
MSSNQHDDEVADAILTPEEHASLTSRYGDKATAYEAGGRRWVFRRPSRAQWRAYKCDQNSMDPTTKADAGVALARGCLAPFDPKGTVEAERAAFDALGEDYPGLLDLFASIVEASAIGPLPFRGVKPPSSSPGVAATSTPPPKA